MDLFDVDEKAVEGMLVGGAVGVVSDDTQLSFDTVIVLLANGYIDYEDLASMFSSHKMFGIGGT